MRRLLLAGLLAVCACSDQASEAERRYEIVKRDGDAEAICAQGKAVVAAYLQTNNESGYRQRKVATAIECMAAMRRESDGIFRMPDGTDQRIVADDLSNTEANYGPAASAAAEDNATAF